MLAKRASQDQPVESVWDNLTTSALEHISCPQNNEGLVQVKPEREWGLGIMFRLTSSQDVVVLNLPIACYSSVYK